MSDISTKPAPTRTEMIESMSAKRAMSEDLRKRYHTATEDLKPTFAELSFWDDSAVSNRALLEYTKLYRSLHSMQVTLHHLFRLDVLLVQLKVRHAFAGFLGCSRHGSILNMNVELVSV